VVFEPDDALEEAEGAALATTDDATTDDTTALDTALEPAMPPVTEEPATPVEEGTVAPVAPVAATLPVLATGWPTERPISLLPNVLDRRAPILRTSISVPDSTHSQEHRPRCNWHWRNRSFPPSWQWRQKRQRPMRRRRRPRRTGGCWRLPRHCSPPRFGWRVRR
jgi:hypothetical protein